MAHHTLFWCGQWDGVGSGCGSSEAVLKHCAGVGCLLAPPQRLGGGCVSEEAHCSPPNPGVCAGSTLLGCGRWWAAGSHRTTPLCGQPHCPVGMGSSDDRGGCCPGRSSFSTFASAFEQLPCCCDSQPDVRVHSNLCLLLFPRHPYLHCLYGSMQGGYLYGQAGSEFQLPGSDFLWPSIIVLRQQWGSAGLCTCCATWTGLCRVKSFTSTNLEVEKVSMPKEWCLLYHKDAAFVIQNF